MNPTLKHPATVIAYIFVCVALMWSSLSCGFRKPWRSYEQQPFDSQKWRDGDAITRGTMAGDLHRNPALMGQRQEGVVALLGEPDKKRSNNGLDVWLYQVEVAGEKPKQYFAVSFNKNGGASSGEVKGGTLSLLVDE